MRALFNSESAATREGNGPLWKYAMPCRSEKRWEITTLTRKRGKKRLGIASPVRTPGEILKELGRREVTYLLQKGGEVNERQNRAGGRFG